MGRRGRAEGTVSGDMVDRWTVLTFTPAWRVGAEAGREERD